MFLHTKTFQGKLKVKTLDPNKTKKFAKVEMNAKFFCQSFDVENRNYVFRQKMLGSMLATCKRQNLSNVFSQ
jgi:hypothetical protein